MTDPVPGDKITVVGQGEEGEEDEEFTIREVIVNPDMADGYFEVVAEEDGEVYEIHNDGAGWVSD